MKQVSYYKDFRHNYLILKTKDETVDSYERRMITDNHIKGLIASQERHADGELLLYYEITSKQNLKSLYERKKISLEEIRKLFVQIRMVWEGLTEYLLNEQKLVLDPEYIFADPETEELFFLYDPIDMENAGLEHLVEFLSESVDSEDKEAIEAVYRMLGLIEKEQFVLDEVIEWFEEDYGEKRVKELVNEGNQWDQQILQSEAELPLVEPEEEKTGKQRIIGTKGLLVCFLGAILMAGILLYFYLTYQLRERVQILLLAGLLLSVILAIACIALVIYERFWKKEEKEAAPMEESYTDDYVQEQVQEKAKQAYGNTVFIPWTECCENKLYGVGKENKNHIDLKKLPLIVGKLAGSVDLVIENSSISRRHVKFFREGDRIYMTDLNSTNGTYKNGLRMLPNTSEALEPGDEIRLGKLKFIYR